MQITRSDARWCAVRRGNSLCPAYIASGLLLVFANENQDLLRVVLSEVLVNAELRERYIQEIVAPTFVVILQQLAPLAEQSRIRSENLVLRLQLMSSMVLGVLMARMFNEQLAQSTWEQLPDVLTDLFFDGLFHE